MPFDRKPASRRALVIGTGSFAPALLCRLLTRHPDLTPVWKPCTGSTAPPLARLKRQPSGRVLRVAPRASMMLHQEEAGWRRFFQQAAAEGWALIHVQRRNLLDHVAAEHDGTRLDKAALIGSLVAAEGAQSRITAMVASLEPLMIDSAAFDTAAGQIAALVAVQRHIGVPVRDIRPDPGVRIPRRFAEAVDDAGGLIAALEETGYGRFVPTNLRSSLAREA